MFEPVESNPLDQAAVALERARAARAAADAKVAEAEAALLALVTNRQQEGTTRADTEHFKISVVDKINRSVDSEELARIAPQIPEAIGRRLINWKPELRMTELRFIQNNEPEIYAIVAKALTAKPAKPSVSVERIEQKQAA